LLHDRRAAAQETTVISGDANSSMEAITRGNFSNKRNVSNNRGTCKIRDTNRKTETTTIAGTQETPAAVTLEQAVSTPTPEATGTS
jgi:hypothetical protein